MIKYIVLSVEPIVSEQRPSARMRKKHNSSTNSSHSGSVRINSKLAECVIARDKDFGVRDTQFTCITHLGPLLQPGDTVLGYDLSNTNLNLDKDTEKSFKSVTCVPDVILVRKVRTHLSHLLIRLFGC